MMLPRYLVMITSHCKVFLWTNVVNVSETYILQKWPWKIWWVGAGCNQISWLSGTCLANRKSLPMRTVVIVGQQICTQQHRMFRSLGLAKGINTKMNIAGVFLMVWRGRCMIWSQSHLFQGETPWSQDPPSEKKKHPPPPPPTKTCIKIVFFCCGCFFGCLAQRYQTWWGTIKLDGGRARCELVTWALRGEVQNGMDDGYCGSFLHPGKLTIYTRKIDLSAAESHVEPKNGGGWKMIFFFNWVIFRFHVNFRGCDGLHTSNGSLDTLCFFLHTIVYRCKWRIHWHTPPPFL